MYGFSRFSIGYAINYVCVCLRIYEAMSTYCRLRLSCIVIVMLLINTYRLLFLVLVSYLWIIFRRLFSPVLCICFVVGIKPTVRVIHSSLVYVSDA